MQLFAHRNVRDAAAPARSASTCCCTAAGCRARAAIALSHDAGTASLRRVLAGGSLLGEHFAGDFGTAACAVAAPEAHECAPPGAALDRQLGRLLGGCCEMSVPVLLHPPMASTAFLTTALRPGTSFGKPNDNNATCEPEPANEAGCGNNICSTKS